MENWRTHQLLLISMNVFFVIDVTGPLKSILKRSNGAVAVILLLNVLLVVYRIGGLFLHKLDKTRSFS